MIWLELWIASIVLSPYIGFGIAQIYLIVKALIAKKMGPD